MMEVKQNTAMDFNDLITSNSNSNSNSDDVHLEATKLKTGLLKTSDVLSSVRNGSNSFNDVAASIDLDADMSDIADEPVNQELEDELLADDETVDKILADVTPKAAAVSLLDDKAETESSSDKLRDPGDDLDTLLSKINDIVEDCIDTKGAAKSEEEKAEEDLLEEDETAEENDEKAEEDLLEEDETAEENVDKNAEEVDDKKAECNESSKDKTEQQKEQKSTTECGETSDKHKIDDDVEMESVDLEEALNETDEKEKANASKSDHKEHQNAKECSADEADGVSARNEENIEDGEIVESMENIVNSGKSMSKLTEKTAEATVAEKVKVCNKEIPTLTLDDDDESSNVLKEPETKDENTDSKEKKSETTKAKVDVPTVNLDADDSDDDVVFFVEKSTVEKRVSKEAEADKKSEAVEKEKSPVVEEDDDDDVVLLDDDDDEVDLKKDEETKTEESEEKKDVPEESKENSDKVVTEEKCQEEKEAPKEKSEKTEVEQQKEEVGAVEETDLLADNTDNARDDFTASKDDVEEKKDTVSSKSADADETNSNYSSSSNLLQEATATASVPEDEAPEEAENENENDDEEEAEAEAEAEVEDADGDGDVELVEDLVTVECDDATKDDDAEEKETSPPAKRMRLSEETEESKELGEDNDSSELTAKPEEKQDSNDDKVEQEEKEKQVKVAENKDEAIKEDENVVAVAVKRSHESLVSDEAEPPEEETAESAMKKPKTEESKCNVEEKKIEEISTDSKVETKAESETDDKKDIKLDADVAKTEPATAIDDEPVEVKIEAKAVPSYIPIPLYPPPKFDDTPSALSLEFFKRFRKPFSKMSKHDLEELALQKIVESIVHKSEFAEMREIIEKQEKIIGAHRTKITELSKQFRDLEMVHNRVIKDIEMKNSQFIMPVKITRAVGLQVYIPNKKNVDAASSLIPPSSPQRGITQTALTSPQRQGSADATTSTNNTRIPNSALASAAAAAAMNTRRGCAQKITPQRPVDPASAVSSTSQMPGYRSHTQSPLTQISQLQQQQNPPKILNKNMIASSTVMQRNRFTAPVSQEQQQRQQQQQQMARQQAQQNNMRKVTPNPQQKPGSVNSAAQQQQQYRRSESTAQTTITPASAAMDNYMTSLNQLSPGVPAVSITPAKPKEKAVIDLTDEDDAGHAQQSAPAAAAARSRPASQNSVNSTNYRTAVPPLTRMPSSNANTQKSQVTARHLSTLQAQKSNGNAPISSITTPPGTSITRINITGSNASQQNRTKYGHPAPLPGTPPQTFNPAWKLPPPRPTIRISNLDNGIVISWTMEEIMDRHADCVSYQIYAYQETSGPPMVDSWRHVGDVKAMLLPMAVTLTQFQEGQRYFFAVRAVDVHQRFGPFSMPKTWS